MPDAGALVKVTSPVKSYTFAGFSQKPRKAVKFVIRQFGVHAAGAVKLVVNVQVGVAEKAAVALHADPSALKPEIL